MSRDRFEKLWNQPLPRRERPARAPLGADNSENCPFAEEFEAYAVELVGRVKDQQSVEAVNVGKLLLTDKLYERLSFVPAKHRYMVGNAKHRCVRDVMDDAFTSLQAIQARLEPPKTALPKPSPRRKKPEPEPTQTISTTLLGFKDRVE
jgi:hypothetical protein